MSHLDDDRLADLALGSGDPAAAAHTEACDACRAELDDLRCMLGRLRDGASAAPLLAPPDSVWEGIVAEIHAPAETSEESEPALEPVGGGEPQAPVDELRERRASRVPAWTLVGAAAAGVVIGGLGVGTVLALGGEDAGQVVAQAPLTDLTTETDAGTALLETLDDGTQVLVVDTDYVPLDDAYLEVWLIDENIEGMVSLGHLTGNQTTFELPEGFDPGAFPIVDISVEPLDGVPTHSGDSVTRGVLDA